MRETTYGGHWIEYDPDVALQDAIAEEGMLAINWIYRVYTADESEEAIRLVVCIIRSVFKTGSKILFAS